MRLNSKELKKHFYSIPELAAKWGCDEKDIIHLAISREIFLSVNLDQYSLPNASGWWNISLPQEIATLLTGQNIFIVTFFHLPDDDDNLGKYITFRPCGCGDGVRGGFEFLRSEVFVRGRYVEKFELNHPEKFVNDHPVELNQPPKDCEQTTKQGGRPPSQLYLGVEAFYLEKLAAGQIDLLQPQAGAALMDELRRSVNSQEFSSKAAGHIRKLERKSGHYRVFVHDPPEIDGKSPKRNEKPAGYATSAVSKIVSRLRKKYPLE